MPRIRLSWSGRLALYGLRVYLLVMLVLILVKFVKVIGGGPPHP
jgi:hypothetical protein